MNLAMKSIIAWFILIAIACPTVGFADETGVVKNWLALQSDIKSLTADFKQERRTREGSRPIVTEGKFAYSAPGSFRWQMGDPAVTLAVQETGGDLVVVNVRRKRAKVYPLELLKSEEAAMGFSFIEAGFPKTQEEFEKNFTIKGVETRDGLHHVTVGINDRRTSMGLRKMVFYLAENTYELRGFYLRFRTSGSITTTFSGVKKNGEIPDSTFKLDLGGYETTTHKAK